MLITTVTNPDSTVTALNGTSPIGSPGTAGPYREVWYTDIVVPDGCESVTVDETAPLLNGRFLTSEPSLQGEALDTVLENADGGVRLELPNAWLFKGIDLVSTLGGKALCLHRYDGAQVVGEESLRVSLSGSGYADVRSKEFLANIVNMRVKDGTSAVPFVADQVESVHFTTYPSTARLGWALAHGDGTDVGPPAVFHALPGQVLEDTDLPSARRPPGPSPGC